MKKVTLTIDGSRAYNRRIPRAWNRSMNVASTIGFVDFATDLLQPQGTNALRFTCGPAQRGCQVQPLVRQPLFPDSPVSESRTQSCNET